MAKQTGTVFTLPLSAGICDEGTEMTVLLSF